MFYQVQQQLFFLKLQQEKMQTDFEDIQVSFLVKKIQITQKIQLNCFIFI